jgi:ankyrin repeat protein
LIKTSFFRTSEGVPPIELAVREGLVSVVKELCAKGAELNVKNALGDPILWQALQNGREDIASVLVGDDFIGIYPL